MGFATSIIGAEQYHKAAASAHKALFSLVKNAMQFEGIPEPKSPLAAEEPPIVEPEPEPPRENQTLKFLNALMGGKD
jgi:hypothetical protein